MVHIEGVFIAILRFVIIRNGVRPEDIPRIPLIVGRLHLEIPG